MTAHTPMKPPAVQNTPGTAQVTDLPPFFKREGLPLTRQIEAYFRNLLGGFYDAHPVSSHGGHPGPEPVLTIPAAMHLSGFFHCSECDILDALHKMQAMGYEFDLVGWDSPIHLYDPHRRRGMMSGWRKWTDAFFHPRRTLYR